MTNPDYKVTFPNGSVLITSDREYADKSILRHGGTITTLAPVDASETVLGEDLRVEASRENQSRFLGGSK